jgi:hypothetical protein
MSLLVKHGVSGRYIGSRSLALPTDECCASFEPSIIYAKINPKVNGIKQPQA